jgi:tetratricopeptide (TPR) repeat protein
MSPPVGRNTSPSLFFPINIEEQPTQVQSALATEVYKTYTAIEIAQSLWLDLNTRISEDMVQKVNKVSTYLNSCGYELKGVKADGDCFCNAFLGSYRMLSRTIPLLDAAPNSVTLLREQIASIVERNNLDRAQEIRKNGEWITAAEEGDLLAKAFKIPIRVVTVNKDKTGSGVSDMLTFPESHKPQQTWETLAEKEKPEEYIMIVDLGGHFVFAEPTAQRRFKENPEIVADTLLLDVPHLNAFRRFMTPPIGRISPSPIVPIPCPGEEVQRELSPTESLLDSTTWGELKRKKEDSKITSKECASKRPRTSFEDQLAQSMDELNQIEEEWKIYQCDFALTHFEMEGASPPSEIDWEVFRSTLRENFSRRLKCCEVYDEGHHEIVDDLYFWKLKVLVHQKYVLQGTLNFMDGNIDQAVELFYQAIRLCPERLLVWLFLTSALHRLERYQEVITLVEIYCRDKMGDLLIRLGPCRPSSEFVFSLYSQFSRLTDDCIEQNFLQFTHPIYVNTEMHYYLAKARRALSPSDPENQRSLATVFNRRGIECMMGGWYRQAVFNFEKAKELLPDRFLGDHYAKSLFAIGRINEALQELKRAVERASDDGQRVKYLNRLIGYYIQCEQIGDADAYLDQISEEGLSDLLHVHLAYLRTKVKLSLKNPSFSALKKGMEGFFKHYQKLSLSCQEREAGSWLRGCLELQDNFCKNNVARGEIGDIIQTHRLLIGIFKQLIASLEKDFFPHHKLEKEAYFPNRIYDRLYLSYFIFLMAQYLMFNSCRQVILKEFDLSPEQAQMSEKLLSDYKGIEGEIKDKLQLYQLRRALLEKDESEIFQRHKVLAHLIKTIDALASEDKPESAEATSMSTDSELATLDKMIGDYEELLRPVSDNTTFLDLYRSSLREVQISCANTEENFFDMHVMIIARILQYDFWPNFIELLTLKETDAMSPVSSFESVSRAIEAWLSILTIYKTTIQDEPHPVLKKAHVKAIDDCQMHFFPRISRILLEYFNRLQAAGCTTLALKAVEHLKSLVPPLRGALEELSSSQRKQLELLFRNFDEVLAQASQITSQRSLTEISKQLQAHPLDLIYGKNSSTYRVPFPNEQIIDSLRQLKQAEKIQENVNLSVHYLTVVYHRRARDGTKGPRKTYHLPLTPPQEFFTAEQLRYPNQKYMDRIERGYQIYQSTLAQVKEDLTLSFQEAEIKHDFDPFYHRHSEQAFFEWLSLENPNQLIAQIRQKEPEFRADCKVDMVAFDTGSSFASCLHCRLSALSMQSGKQEQGDFLARLEKALLMQRFHLPREKDGVGLKAVTRILADTRRQEDRAFPHTNPKERNVKHLKNLGLFQHIVNGVFASGSSHKVKKQ